MEEQGSPRSSININRYARMDLVEVIEACGKLPVRDAVTVINLREKDLLSNPPLLSLVLEDPKLQEMIAKTNLMKSLLGPNANGKLSPAEASEIMSAKLISIVERLPSASKDLAETILHLRKKELGEDPNAVQPILKLLQDPKPDLQNATAVIQKNKGFLKTHPELLLMVLKTPALEKAVEDSKLVGNLMGKITKENLGLMYKTLIQETDATGQLRALRNHVVTQVYSAIPKGSANYSSNPKAHGGPNESIEDLATYLINSPEVASQFLGQKRVQEQLSKNPTLLAKMIIEGDQNLRQTMQETGVLDHPDRDTKEALHAIGKIKDTLNTPALAKNRFNLTMQMKSLYRTEIVGVNKNEAKLHANLSLPDAQGLLKVVFDQAKTFAREAAEKSAAETKTSHTATHPPAVSRALTETAKETDKVEYIGPPIQALLQEAKKEQQREKRAESSSRAVQKKWPQPEKTIKASHVTKDVELQKATAELKKSEPVTPPPSPPTRPLPPSPAAKDPGPPPPRPTTPAPSVDPGPPPPRPHRSGPGLKN